MIYFELFYTFFLIGLFTFGGGYAMIPLIEDNVLSKGWLESSTLTDFIAISESTPGPFAINIATFIGNNVGGVFGSLCATIGVVLPSIIIILIIAFIIDKFLKNRFVKGALNGVKPVVLALILSTTIVLITKIIFFNGNAIYSDFNFDIKALVLLINLMGIMSLYKYIKKKSISPIALIFIAALYGILIYI